MNAFETIPVLNQLLSLLCHSLPAYLADVKTLARSEGERVRVALGRLVADQQMYAQRVADAIAERGGRPNPGRFPTEFTAKNDLSLGFLLPEIIDFQRQTVATIEQCVGRLEGESALHALAEEILGNAKGHLDILAEMRKDKG
jgi:hypothetical protein